MLQSITLLEIYNRTLKLIGDYTLTNDSVTNNTGLYQMVQSLCREAGNFVYDELRSNANLRSMDCSAATLVGDNYELDLGSVFLFRQAFRFFKTDTSGKVIKTFDFTENSQWYYQPVRFEYRVSANPAGTTVLIFDPEVKGSEPLSELKLQYFYAPNFYNIPSASIQVNPQALEIICYRAAQALAINLNEDINLATTYGNLAADNLMRLKKTTSLTYGRPFYATFKG
jgi:hypothetical protein